MGGGEASRGAASLRGMASRRAAGGSFFRAATMGSADPQGPICLPDGLAVVVRSSRGAQAVRGDPGGDGKPMRRSPTAAFKAFAGVKDFSRVACLAFPSESADAFCRMGYARLQVLLGYIIPEMLDEDWLSEEEAAKLAEGETENQAPLHVPYRPYVVVSLNGRDVYQSAVVSCEPPSSEDAEAVGCLRGMWDERVELQLHHPYSLLRIALFDKDTTEAAIGADELLGALDFQLHLLMPHRIYDIAAFFPPFAVLDDVVLAGKDETFALLQGTRRLHPSADTRTLLQEPACSVCGDSSNSCKHSNSGDTDGTLYSAELDGQAIEAAVVQQQQVDLGCCRMRLMLQLLPHKVSGSGKIPILDELSALLLPAPREAGESALPPLNFTAVWADLQDAQRKITEGALGVLVSGLCDALYWERPVLSLVFLLTFVFLWLHPQFLPAAFLLLLGLLLLIISFIQMPPAPGMGDQGSLSGEQLATDGAAAGVAQAALAGGGGSGASGGRKPGGPGTLQAFEMAESSECCETSLLRSLLSAAVPVPLQLQVRKFHHRLRQGIAGYTYYHSRLCERREVIVGALWVLGAWAAVEPAEACSVARYLVLATGISLLTCHLYVVGAGLRLLIACYRQIRLYRQRRGRQHLVAVPMA